MSQAGRLLVATPLIADPNFERSVALVLAHSGEGALGVVVNRPSETTVAEVVPAWAGLAVGPGVVFVGGPVGRDQVIGVARCPRIDDGPTWVPPGSGTGPILGDCWTVDLNEAPEPGIQTDLRLFAGSAGWAAGQLEDELAEGAWWAVDAHPSDLVTSDPDGLWGRVLRRQPGEVAWFANHPEDPSTN
ncbi:MAG: YqgE/AlgH family protein [Acidimicrobiales bacterium]